MMRIPITEKRILAIDPNVRGFGYVVLEGSQQLVDWGQRSAPGPNNRVTLQAALELISRYQPQVLILEDARAEGCWKRARQRRLLAVLERRAAERGLAVRRVSRWSVLRFRSAHGIRNKD